MAASTGDPHKRRPGSTLLEWGWGENRRPIPTCIRQFDPGCHTLLAGWVRAVFHYNVNLVYLQAAGQAVGAPGEDGFQEVFAFPGPGIRVQVVFQPLAGEPLKPQVPQPQLT